MTVASSQYPAGPIGSLNSTTSLSNEAPQQSHIQLPPLNCILPPQPAMPSRLSNLDKSYLYRQRPSCSYPTGSGNCDIELDDIRIESLHSMSPPALDGEKPKDGDSDCDYSDMPRLSREDSEEALIEKQPEPVEVRASSRQSLTSE